MSFLKAEWRKLAMVNYHVPEQLLAPYVPAGTELDLWNGECYVSLVGFRFLNTKLLGLKIPFHVHFEEVNLRFYVKREVGGSRRRGVVFIKEIVPKPALTFVANAIYKENYETLPMRHLWEESDVSRNISYQWKKKGHWHGFSVRSDLKAIPIPENSEIEFITEHYWGYAHINEQKSVEYEVTHPRWEHYPVQNYEIDVDFGLTYGPEFSFLNEASPKSVLLAEGSAITVERGKRLKKGV